MIPLLSLYVHQWLRPTWIGWPPTRSSSARVGTRLRATAWACLRLCPPQPPRLQAKTAQRQVMPPAVGEGEGGCRPTCCSCSRLIPPPPPWLWHQLEKPGGSIIRPASRQLAPLSPRHFRRPSQRRLCPASSASWRLVASRPAGRAALPRCPGAAGIQVRDRPGRIPFSHLPRCPGASGLQFGEGRLGRGRGLRLPSPETPPQISRCIT